MSETTELDAIERDLDKADAMAAEALRMTNEVDAMRQLLEANALAEKCLRHLDSLLAVELGVQEGAQLQ